MFKGFKSFFVEHFIVFLSCICLSNVLKFKGESLTVEVERQNFRLRRQRPKNKAEKDINKGLAGKNQRRRGNFFGVSRGGRGRGNVPTQAAKVG